MVLNLGQTLLMAPEIARSRPTSVFFSTGFGPLSETYDFLKDLLFSPDALASPADFIGSTTGLLKFTMRDEATAYIVATESGILHQMQKASPHKTFIPAPPNNNCACNDCPHMKRNTMEKLYLCMEYEMPEILLPDWIIEQGRKSIDRMLEISAQSGL